jgi:hypothetical protein
MALLGRYGYYTRMAGSLWKMLGTSPIEDTPGFLRRQLENREQNFLATVREIIFGVDGNPYREMFRVAGCEYSDLESGVNRDGLEPTLIKLLEAGVTLSHDEFKGIKTIVRNGKELRSGPEAFRNPLVKTGLVGRSGGSRSAGTPVVKSISRLKHTDAYTSLRVREFDLVHRRIVQVRPILPAGDGLTIAVRYKQMGCAVDRWFAPTGTSWDSAHYLLATRLLVGMTRLRGQKAPFPQLLPPNDFSAVSEYLASSIARGFPCQVGGTPSSAARIATSALDHGHDISGTLFLTGGEPLTAAKQETIEAAGAEAYSGYWISEIGPIGWSCRAMKKGNSVHVFTDSVAVVAKAKRAPLTDIEVNSLHFTTLLPYASFVLVNAEFDDSGHLEMGRCDCEFGRLGFHSELRDIASFGKLTGYGITLVGTHMVEILERVLPARFGGRSTDYQIVEDLAGAKTSIQLLVSPRVPTESLDTVRECFLHEIRRYQGGASASRLLKDVEAFSVKRAEPHVTVRGKILPLHLVATRNGRGAGA